MERLDVVEVLDDVDQLLHALGVVARQRDRVLGPHRHFGDLGDEAGLLERRLDRLEVGRRGDDLDRAVVVGRRRRRRRRRAPPSSPQSSLVPGAKTSWPQWRNWNATEPSAPRLPPYLLNAWRTSATVRTRLSVMQSTIIAAPPMP
jgi:hypothetical protein